MLLHDEKEQTIDKATIWMNLQGGMLSEKSLNTDEWLPEFRLGEGRLQERNGFDYKTTV